MEECEEYCIIVFVETLQDTLEGCGQLQLKMSYPPRSISQNAGAERER